MRDRWRGRWKKMLFILLILIVSCFVRFILIFFLNYDLFMENVNERFMNVFLRLFKDNFI